MSNESPLIIFYLFGESRLAYCHALIVKLKYIISSYQTSLNVFVSTQTKWVVARLIFATLALHNARKTTLKPVSSLNFTVGCCKRENSRRSLAHFLFLSHIKHAANLSGIEHVYCGLLQVASISAWFSNFSAYYLLSASCNHSWSWYVRWDKTIQERTEGGCAE